MTIKLAANLRWMFSEWPLEQRFEVAAALGFPAVEFAFPYSIDGATLASKMADLDLAMAQIAAPMNWEAGERGLATIPGREADFRRSIEIGVKYATHFADRPLVHVLAGSTPDGVEPAQARDVLLDNLAWAGDAAGAEGVVLTIEPVCSARFPNFIFHTLAEGAAVLDELNRDNVRLCFDTFHVQMEQGNLIANLEAFLPRSVYVQIGNPPERHEPGAGELDLSYFLTRLDALGYGGYVGCELLPSGPTLESLDWAAPYGIEVRELASAQPASTNRPRSWRDLG